MTGPRASSVRFFASSSAFRRWLAKNHGSARELWVGFYTKESGRGGITYPQALDEALCFGWIDGVRYKVAAPSYTNRFSPRKTNSRWSAANIKRVALLRAAGRMTPAGIKAFEARTSKASAASRLDRLPRVYEARFARQPGARAFFEGQAPWYRRTAIFWVTSAAKEETRLRRLRILIADSSQGRRLAAVGGRRQK